MNLLITGGTGSLGQALVERLLTIDYFQKICIYSRDEHKQEKMARRFNNNDRLRFFIGDIRDKDRLALSLEGITHVIHAAALKIVPSIEYNPFEAIKTNILGAQNLIECLTAGATKMLSYGTKVVAVSTDKAVKPINLYGATKLCAEKLFISANNIRGPLSHRYSVVRYGNVSNSNGSVIPLFKSQIERNEQLTITDDRMSRFWITLDQAVEFVLNSMGRMYGGETFVPDMPSFSIKDLAMTMMKNYPPEKQFVKIVGIRPGEKLYEEIITKEEFTNCDYDPQTKTFIVSPPWYEHNTQTDIDQEIKANGMNSDSHFVKRMGQEEIEKELIKLGVMG